VERVSQQEAAQRMLALKGADRGRLHEEFWQGERQF
jgi:hypothetical protein